MHQHTKNSIVIYDKRTRWVATLNMTFAIIAIYFAINHADGFFLYYITGFLILFAAFWIRDFIFGFRANLQIEDNVLYWREGSSSGSIPIVNIEKIVIGLRRPQYRRGISWTSVKILTNLGEEISLPPNLSSGLRSYNWKHLKDLMICIRGKSEVTVESMKGPYLIDTGWEEDKTLI